MKELIMNFKLPKSGSQKSGLQDPDPLVSFPSLQEERVPSEGSLGCVCSKSPFTMESTVAKESRTRPKGKRREGSTEPWERPIPTHSVLPLARHISSGPASTSLPVVAFYYSPRLHPLPLLQQNAM